MVKKAVQIPYLYYKDNNLTILKFLNKIYHIDNISGYDYNYKENPLLGGFSENFLPKSAGEKYTFLISNFKPHVLEDVIFYAHYMNIILRKYHYDYLRFVTINVNRDYVYSHYELDPYDYTSQIDWFVQHVLRSEHVLACSVEKGKAKHNPYLHYHIILFQKPQKTKNFIRRVKHVLNPNHSKFYPGVSNPCIKESELDWSTLFKALLYWMGVSPSQTEDGPHRLKGDAYQLFILRNFLTYGVSLELPQHYVEDYALPTSPRPEEFL